MKKESSQFRGRDYIADLAATGCYHFSSTDLRESLGVSPGAARLVLNRLVRRKLIASPARGFYVIVPPEYRALGCLPADQFVPALMQRLGLVYYAGLLSAAQYYGAAHHRPQEFQVMVEAPRHPIKCGQVRVAFIVRKRLRDVPVQSFNTPRGTITVSTAEATAVDLIGYHHRAGGLDQVATLFLELAEQIDPSKLVEAAQTAPIPWAQRMGYLLELVGFGEKVVELGHYVKDAARDAVPLLPGASRETARRNPTWKLFINVDVEPDL